MGQPESDEAGRRVKDRMEDRRRTDDGSTVYTDINLTYDVNGNITLYDDSTGLRHQKYYAAVDKLDRLRCLSRASISSCTGSKPWESKFTESFDYDKSGNRTNRRGGGFTADDEVYAYVSGPTDIIDKVTVNSVAKEQSNTFKGQITATNIPGSFAYSYDREDHLANSNDNSLGNVGHYHTLFADRYARQSTCNARRTYFYSQPAPETGASPQTSWINLYNTCLAEFPRQLHTYVWLGERPLAVLRSAIASGTDAQTELGTYWVHVDHLGTPVLVTQSNKTERWRWENDPFGRGDPVEYTVSGQDVSPDDDASSGTPLKYNTCCCGGGGCGAGCNQCQTSCSAGQCTGGGSQDVLWQKTYTVAGANNVRLHFSTFDVAAGTTRTGKDYVRLLKGSDGTTVVADLTGNLGDFWGPWAGVGESSIVMKLYGDNVQDNTRGFVVDKLEYTTATNGRFVMHLRMPGQVWDEEAKMSQNFHRWYRREDGRYLTPDPIGLAGGEPGYFGYANGAPATLTDAEGLKSTFDGDPRWREGLPASPGSDCEPPPPGATEDDIRAYVRCNSAAFDSVIRGVPSRGGGDRATVPASRYGVPVQNPGVCRSLCMRDPFGRRTQNLNCDCEDVRVGVQCKRQRDQFATNRCDTTASRLCQDLSAALARCEERSRAQWAALLAGHDEAAEP